MANKSYFQHSSENCSITISCGIPNVVAAGKAVLKDWSSGKIVFYTHPPEQHRLPTHLSADIVSEWSKEYDVGSLQQQEQAELHGLRHTVEDAMVLEAGGPVDAAEVEEEDMDSEEEEEESDEAEGDDDEDESDEEAMEGSDVETQKDGMAVLLKTAKSITQSQQVTQSRGKADSALNADEINEFNQLSNKERKKIFKKQQKERRKQAESSAEAMDDSDDDYNFDTHFS